MPYRWTDPTHDTPTALTLWPHQSLPPRGMASFVLATFTMITLPLFGLLGTVLFWALLPFLMLAVGGIWFALDKSYKDRSIVETLTMDDQSIVLEHRDPKHDPKVWNCNVYWAKPTLHTKGGPVPNYVTLSGNGKEVEIGSFLTEEERIALYGELTQKLADCRNAVQT